MPDLTWAPEVMRKVEAELNIHVPLTMRPHRVAVAATAALSASPLSEAVALLDKLGAFLEGVAMIRGPNSDSAKLAADAAAFLARVRGKP